MAPPCHATLEYVAQSMETSTVGKQTPSVEMGSTTMPVRISVRVVHQDVLNVPIHQHALPVSLGIYCRKMVNVTTLKSASGAMEECVGCVKLGTNSQNMAIAL